MAGFIKRFLKISIVATVLPAVAFGAQQPNPRGTTSLKSVRSADLETSASIRRSATSVIARNANVRENRVVVTSRPSVARSGRSISKVRSATNPTTVRSGVALGTKTNGKKTSRAATARATAVFNDITKIGGGYSGCRDSYATCMDQFCANANDTYRRCFCSDRFANFRETEDSLDSALQMLAQFQDNNLNAVDKTASEVNAMYTATAGENAIKKDTSASQKLLDNISAVLSGRQVSKTTSEKLGSLGVLDFSGFSGDDVWGGSSSSIFGGKNANNLTDLEGKELYNAAAEQCMEITRDACSSDAMFNLARSAYSIMITQDCNVYEKNINTKRESIKETVRTAEKYLRDARLEEYRAHNSQDVNECLSKVENAMRQTTACGPDYEKCMDYTGQYINSVTGEPIYSQALFGLNNLIKLDGSADVLSANPSFDKWLEDKKMFATNALDTCRDLSNVVWPEFKRAALIQIAQAQDEKIQQIKDSCVTTIKECYDTQTNSMKSMNTTKMKSTDAIAAVTARGMCYDRVQACAALYGDVDGCAYNDATKTLSAVAGKKCGLQSLLTFVDTVDSLKVAEGCETALTKYAHELCDPHVGSDKDIVYPMGCATMPRSELRAAMNLRMKTFCAQDLVNNDDSGTIQDQSAFNTNIMNQIIKDIYDDLGIAFTSGCDDEGGKWISNDNIANINIKILNQEFYKKYYGTTIINSEQISKLNMQDVGWCVVNTRAADTDADCERVDGKYDQVTGECELRPEWFSDKCKTLGGNWDGDRCVIENAQDYLK